MAEHDFPEVKLEATTRINKIVTIRIFMVFLLF